MLDIPLMSLRSMYTTMLRIRMFEERVRELLLQGELLPQGEIKCPVHLYTGQEAVATGVCANLRKDDYVFSTHRSHGHYIAKGGDIKALMAELYGRATGCAHGKGGSMHLAAPEMGLPGSCAIVAGTVPLAVGAALAFSLQQRDTVAVSFFGDGAVSEGVWYESLNFASLKKLPVVFVCENNLYSTHLPIKDCLADTAIYRKAQAFDLPAVRIDGNNVLKVYETAKKAIEAARAGAGPTLIECLTYRWYGHVGPHDDLDKLRSKEEWDYWVRRCPVKRLERYLLKRGILSPSEKTRLRQLLDKENEEALLFAKASPYPEEGEVLNDVFAETGVR